MRMKRQLEVAPPPAHCACHRAFTLIELLVVIAVIALLMAILMPCLQRVRKQARAAGCQAKLHQCGLYFSAYAAEHEGRLDMNNATHIEASRWYYFLQVLAGNSWERKDMLLCPMARQPKPAGELKWDKGEFHAFGDTFSAWLTKLPAEVSPGPQAGSYGMNGPVRYERSESLAKMDKPVYIDCAFPEFSGWSNDEPPAYEGCFDYYPDQVLSLSCLNRHDGGVNCLFLDWSVRKVGLKELWTLRWYNQYNTHGPWTRAGGARPEDWPQWMRQFKDY